MADLPGPHGKEPAQLRECLSSMLRSLERTVGFAEGVVMSFDPDVLLPNGFAATSGPEMTDALVACRNEQLDEDPLKFRDLAVSKSRVGVASRQADPWTRASPRWLEILDVRGHGHELRAALVDRLGQCWGAFNFQREPRHPFTERDIRLVEGGLKRNATAIARSMVAARVPEPGTEPGTVWLDTGGGIVFASPAAQRWLDLLEAGSYRGFSRALLAGLAMRAGAAPGQACAVRARSAGGRWVRAHAEKIVPSDGNTRGVAVVIDAARAGDVLPLAAGAYQLTGRELEVVRGVLNGLDTRSVAASLRISEYTVQDHLKSVFTKTGVQSRRELAHQLAVRSG